MEEEKEEEEDGEGGGGEPDAPHHARSVSLVFNSWHIQGQTPVVFSKNEG